MTFVQLQDALKAGYSDKSKADELGLFGIGFNVASARLGRRVEVLTRKKGGATRLSVWPAEELTGGIVAKESELPDVALHGGLRGMAGLLADHMAGNPSTGSRCHETGTQ
jgi:hypothetical protein